MNFIHPSFLFGLAVAAIPLLVHLLRQRRVKRVFFSSLEFLKLLHKKHSLRIRIDQSLLLAARISLATAVVLLFAQPYFSIEALAFLNSGPRQVVAFVDNSGSMGLTGPGGRTLFQEAQSQLHALASRLGPRESLTVVALAPAARIVFHGKPADFSLPAELALHSGQADLDGAVRLAHARASESPGAEQRLAVFSDFSRLNVEALRLLECETLFFPVRFDGLTNHAAGPIASSVERVVRGESVTFRVRIGRYGAAKEATAELAVDGRVVDRRALGVRSGPEDLVFTHRFEQAGTRVVTVTLSPDALPADNQAATVVEVLEQRRLQLVTGRQSTPAEGARDPLFFVRRALSRTALTVTESPEKLEGTSLVALVRPDLLTEQQTRDLTSYLKGGGAVLVFLGADEIDPAAANKTWMEKLALLRVGKKVEGTSPWRATQARPPAGLVESRYWEGVASTARFLLEPLPGFRREGVLAAFDDGTPAVSVMTVERGSMAVLNCGPSLAGCDAPLHPVFPIFLARLAGYCPERLLVCRAGEQVAFSLPLEDFGARFQVTAPAGKVAVLTPERRGRELRVSFSATDRPGLYRFEKLSGDQRSTRHFVVLWPPQESEMEFPPIQKLLDLVPRSRAGSAGAATAWSGRLASSAADLLLVAVVMLMLAEAWLVRDLERQIARDVVA